MRTVEEISNYLETVVESLVSIKYAEDASWELYGRLSPERHNLGGKT